LRALARFKSLTAPSTTARQLAPPLQADFANLGGREQVGHFKSFLEGSAFKTKWIKRFTEESGVLAMREVAPGGPIASEG